MEALIIVSRGERAFSERALMKNEDNVSSLEMTLRELNMFVRSERVG